MKKLIILIGTIGSGKSTLAKKFSKSDYVTVSRDAMRYMIKSGEYCFNPVYEPCIKSINLFAIEEFAKKGFNVVVDECCLNKSLRKSITSIGKRYKYAIYGILMPKISMKESVARRLKNNHGKNTKKTWESVYKMFKTISNKVTKREGFYKIIELQNNYDFKKLLKDLE